MSSLDLRPSKRTAAALALGAGVWLTVVPARADEVSIGLGAGFDRGRVKCISQFPCDRKAEHAKVFASYTFTQGLELQALGFHGGSFDGGDIAPLGTPFGGRFKVSGLGVAAGYRWRLSPDWSLRGQLGGASVRTRFAYASPFSGEASKTTTQPLAGLSLGWRVAPNWQLSLDLDETRFKAHTTRGSLRMLGAALQYSF